MTLPRFAWFVMLHHKPTEFDWLINAIDDGIDPILIHVDAKSRLGIKANRRGVMGAVRGTVAGRPNVVSMRSRFTNWGGWSLSQVLLDAIALALRQDADWRYFVNLSGQCYPLQAMAAIKRQVVAAGEVLHVELQTIAELPESDWHRASPGMIETPLRAIKLGTLASPSRFAMPYKGSQWVVLPRSFCEWIIGAPLTANVRRYLRRRLLSDELLMQTLAINSPFRDSIAPNYRRTIIWPGPKILSVADVTTPLNMSNWFGRKFDLEVAPDALALLAERNGFRPGPVP